MAETKYRYRLTTVDNPFDPFEQYESWLLYDKLHHYNTPETVAAFARTSDNGLTDSLNHEEINDAITRIIVLDPCNMYIRVRQPIPNPYIDNSEE